MKSVLDRFILVNSKTEARTYYLFAPDGREIVFQTKTNNQGYVLVSNQANDAERSVANHLYKLNEIVY